MNSTKITAVSILALVLAIGTIVTAQPINPGQIDPVPQLDQMAPAPAQESEPTDKKAANGLVLLPNGMLILSNGIPPQVIVVPTKFGGEHTAVISGAGKDEMWGIGLSLSEILHMASTGKLPLSKAVSVIVPPNMPAAKFDFIANLPTGNKAALAKVIADQFGWIATPHTVLTNGYLLKVDHADAPGLKPTGDADFESQDHGQKRFYQKRSMTQLAEVVQDAINAPVVDKTDFAGDYDFELRVRGALPMARRLESLKSELGDQLGLKLVETSNLPHVVLVLEKGK